MKRNQPEMFHCSRNVILQVSTSNPLNRELQNNQRCYVRQNQWLPLSRSRGTLHPQSFPSLLPFVVSIRVQRSHTVSLDWWFRLQQWWLLQRPANATPSPLPSCINSWHQHMGLNGPPYVLHHVP